MCKCIRAVITVAENTELNNEKTDLTRSLDDERDSCRELQTTCGYTDLLITLDFKTRPLVSLVKVALVFWLFLLHSDNKPAI